MCNWQVHSKCLMETPELHKIIPARKPCVTDVLCNWQINSQIIECVCNHFGPHSIHMALKMLPQPGLPWSMFGSSNLSSESEQHIEGERFQLPKPPLEGGRSPPLRHRWPSTGVKRPLKRKLRKVSKGVPGASPQKESRKSRKTSRKPEKNLKNSHFSIIFGDEQNR